MKSKKQSGTKCSNCGASPKTHPDRDFIKDSAGLTLCESCINFFNIAKEQITSTRRVQSPDMVKGEIPHVFPEDIFNLLSKRVISQDEAKKTLSIAVAHHYRRLKDPSIGKSNILLIGPTGTGKTELGRGIAEILKVPFISADATTFTTKGYVGDDVDSVVLRLLASCNFDVKLAENGIIFIDEIDKIARRGTGDNQVGTVAVQQELLRLMEGDEVRVNIPNPDSPTGHESVYVNTSKILFICSGAFVGLEEIVNRGNTGSIGINSGSAVTPASNNLGQMIESKHLIQYGVIPEFLGRLPVVAVTHKLVKEDLIKILTDADNSITNQYKKLFAQDEVNLEFSEDFFDDIASQALKKDLGARGLRQLIEVKMKEVFFNIKKYEGQTVQITKDNIVVLKSTPKVKVEKLSAKKI